MPPGDPTAIDAATPLQRLRGALQEALLNVTGGEAPASAPSLDRPRRAAHGDYATNAAMVVAGQLGQPPLLVAERLALALAEGLGDDLRSAEVAGPGFLNLTLSDAWADAVTAELAERGAAIALLPAAARERVHLEYVSNNPTGPVHIGGARGAAFGSALATLLERVGHVVHREYYVNDFGNQVATFGASLRARARGEDVPEDGYRGDYVAELAGEIDGAAERSVEEVALDGVARMLERQRASLTAFRTTFDRWFSERSLHAPGEDGGASPVDAALGVLAEAGRSYEADGALWLRTSDTGDDKDRVMRRADGRPTYFASDVAYHHDKRRRGFDRVIDVLGADHHGYVARIEAAFAALGGDPSRIELLITQFVRLLEDGEPRAMSKRSGEFVTLDDLVAEIGVDAARWYLLARSHDTTIDLDLAEARAQAQENPVYYVQYAHARIASLRRRADEADAAPAEAGAGARPAAERELLHALLAWPDRVTEAAARRAPHRIAAYALELARTFSAFYRDCPVLASDVPAVDRTRRLALAAGTQQVLAAALDVLGVHAPERM